MCVCVGGGGLCVCVGGGPCVCVCGGGIFSPMEGWVKAGDSFASRCDITY